MPKKTSLYPILCSLQTRRNMLMSCLNIASPTLGLHYVTIHLTTSGHICVCVGWGGGEFAGFYSCNLQYISLCYTYPFRQLMCMCHPLNKIGDFFFQFWCRELQAPVFAWLVFPFWCNVCPMPAKASLISEVRLLHKYLKNILQFFCTGLLSIFDNVLVFRANYIRGVESIFLFLEKCLDSCNN